MVKIGKYEIKLRKFHISLIGMVSGLVITVLLYETLTIIAYLISIVCLNVVISPKRKDEITGKEKFGFSVMFLILSTTIFMLLPTNLFTFNANQSVDFAQIVGGQGNVATSVLNIVALIVFFGIPIFMVLGIIWQFVVGNVSGATSNIIKLMVVFGAIMLAVVALADLNMPVVGGIFTVIKDFYVGIVDFLVSLPAGLYQGANGWLTTISAGNVTLPALPTDLANFSGTNQLAFDASQQTYTQWIYTIHTSLPVMASLLCGFFAIVTLRKEWEKGWNEFVYKVADIEITPKEKGLITGRKKEKGTKSLFNPLLLVYMLTIMVIGFFVFINYSSEFGVDPAQDFTYIGYFSFYTASIFAILILYNTQENLYYKRGNLVENVKGIIIGVVLLFLTTRLFYSRQLMTIFSFAGIENSVSYLTNQFIYVAPAESLIFHNFFGSVVIAIIVYSTKRSQVSKKLEENKDLVLFFDNKIIKSEIKAEIYKENKQVKDFAKEKIKLEELKRKRNATKAKIVSSVEITEYEIFGTWKIWFFLMGIILANVLFSSLHFPRSTTGDFFFFWISGLGMMYFVGGILFTFISFKYGWFAGVFTHFAYNSLTIVMVVVFYGL